MRETKGNRGATPRSGGTNHAERVFRVQQAFTQLDGNGHGPGELARITGLDDSTVHRILQSGVQQGMFVRVGHGRYRLGVTAALLGLQALGQGMDHRVVHSALLELRLATGGGLAFLYALAPFGRARCLCIDMAVDDSELDELGLSPTGPLSATRPLRSSTSGRAVLAHLPASLRQRALEDQVPAGAAPGAIHDEDELRRSLVEVRERGYAVGLQECLAGWNSCAVPVLGGELIVGAVLVLKRVADMPSVPSSLIEATRSTAEHLGRLIEGRVPVPSVVNC